MTPEKKITLKHFANVNLKSIESVTPWDRMLYQLYLEIIYRRQHIQIKSMIDEPVTEKLENLNMEVRQQMNREKELVQKIIRFEESIWGDEHRIKGLGKRYTNYRAAIFDIIDDRLRVKLKKTILKHKPEHIGVLNFDNRIVPVEGLLGAAKELWPDLNKYLNLENYQQEVELWQKYFLLFPKIENYKLKYPAFIDWMAEDHYNKIQAALLHENRIDKNLIDDRLNEVNRIVRLATINK